MHSSPYGPQSEGPIVNMDGTQGEHLRRPPTATAVDGAARPDGRLAVLVGGGGNDGEDGLGADAEGEIIAKL